MVFCTQSDKQCDDVNKEKMPNWICQLMGEEGTGVKNDEDSSVAVIRKMGKVHFC